MLKNSNIWIGIVIGLLVCFVALDYITLRNTVSTVTTIVNNQGNALKQLMEKENETTELP